MEVCARSEGYETWIQQKQSHAHWREVFIWLLTYQHQCFIQIPYSGKTSQDTKFSDFHELANITKIKLPDRFCSIATRFLFQALGTAAHCINALYCYFKPVDNLPYSKRPLSATVGGINEANKAVRLVEIEGPYTEGFVYQDQTITARKYWPVCCTA